MSSPDEIVQAFCQAWSVPAADADELSKYFAEDAVYYNIPMEPVVGRVAIRDSFASFLSQIDSIHYAVHHQVASGNVVINERTDTIRVGGHATPLRVMGIFEISDGLITAWREYFDMAEANRVFGQ